MERVIELTIRLKVEVEVIEATSSIETVVVPVPADQPLARDQRLQQAKNMEARRITIALLRGEPGHRANVHLIRQHLERDFGMVFPAAERLQFLVDMARERIVRIQEGRLDVDPPTPAIVELMQELR